MEESNSMGSSPLTSFIQQFDELNVLSKAKSASSAIEHIEPDCTESLTFRLNQFRLSGIGCDVLFVVGEKEKEKILSHKLVLGCSSSVFNAMFYGPLNTWKSGSESNKDRKEKGQQQIAEEQKQQPLQNEYITRFNLQEKLIEDENDNKTQIKNEAKEDNVEYEEVEEGEEEEYSEESSFGSSPSESILSSSCDRNLMGHSAISYASDYNSFNGSKPLDIPNMISTSEAPSNNKIVFVNHENKEKNQQKPQQKLQQFDDEMNPNIQTINVSDCSPTSFHIMLDYIYNCLDIHKITDDNVMYILYTAKKYDIRALVNACVQYLLNGLSPNNAMALLAQARLFQEESLLKQCLSVIDKNTDIALHQDNVRDADRDTLIEVLSRSELDPSSELVIFNAAKGWAEAECARRGIFPNPENLRECLGSAMQLIRYPLMSVNEFGNAASSSLLTHEEIAEVFLYLTIYPHPPCRYPRGYRSNSRSKHCLNRFTALSSKRCTRRENKIVFTADRDIYVSAFGVYGMVKSHAVYSTDERPPNTWSCPVEIQLASVGDPSIYGSSACLIASNNVVLHGQIGDPTPCIAHFAEPVMCQANITYVASARFISETGVQTFAGKDGQENITIQLPFDETMSFRFQSFRNSYGNDDGGKAEGQIPILHFLVQWPEQK